MKRLLLAVVLGFAALGCSNDCDEAVDKLEECGSTATDVDTSDCSGKNECAAKCINDASCEQIKSDEPNSFHACIFACQ